MGNKTSSIENEQPTVEKVDQTQPYMIARDIVLKANSNKKLRFVCISDTHNKHEETILPEGDVLIHAGDFSNRGQEDEIVAFNEFLKSEKLQNFKHKIFISGNHELSFPSKGKEEIERLFAGSTYLEDSGIEIEGIKIWGTPWTSVNMAFHCNPQSEGNTN
jgi:hypothetical protein